MKAGPPRPADPLNQWPRFVGAVHRRLHTGRSIYGDRSFAEDPAKMLAEVQAELLDVAGWSFVLWTRLERIREALDGEGRRQGEDAP